MEINYYAKPKIIIDVPKENFFPSPEVDSCVIKLDVLEKPPVNVKDKDKFFNIVKMAFSQRRKTILNSLSSSNYSKEQVANVLEKLNLDSKLRAEDLSIEDYANISNEI